MKLTFLFLPLPFTFVWLFVWGLKFENKNIDQQLKIKRIITISTSRDFFSKISEIAKFSIWCTSKNSQIFMKKVTSWIFAQPPQALSMAQHWVIVWISNQGIVYHGLVYYRQLHGILFQTCQQKVNK